MSDIKTRAVDPNYDVYHFEDSFRKYEDVPSTCIRESNALKPKFSIFIPTYNRPTTLKVTIDSAIKQLDYYLPYEIIIVSNDPSSVNDDNATNKLVSSYKEKNISFYVNMKNLGLCGSWNRGTELAKGEYIVMIHDDDLLGPYLLSVLSKVVSEKPDVGMIGCGHIDFSGDPPVFTKPKAIHYREVTKKSFFFGLYITIAGMTYKKKLVEEIGGFNEKYYPNEDTNLIYQALLKSNVINLDEILTGYRKEVNLSLSGNTMQNIITHIEKLRRNIAEHEDFAKKWLDSYDRDFLIQYANGAKKNWNIGVDTDQILSSFGMEKGSDSYNIPLSMKVKEKLYTKKYLATSRRTIKL